jgi:uncharacterized protein
MQPAIPQNPSGSGSIVPNVSAKPIPRWKLSLVIWMMVFPLLTTLGYGLNPFLKDRPLLVRNLIMSALFVPVMVYGVLPTAQHTLRKLEQ